jgi:hypothetical protein
MRWPVVQRERPARKRMAWAQSWVDGLMGEGAFGVEGGQQVAQFVVVWSLVEGDVVLLQRGLDAVAREHGRALDDGGRADAVDADQRRVGDGELAHQVAERGLADVVGFGAALGDDGVGGAGEDDAAVEPCSLKSLRPRR